MLDTTILEHFGQIRSLSRFLNPRIHDHITTSIRITVDISITTPQIIVMIMVTILFSLQI